MPVIYCFMVSGLNISNAARDALFYTACRMILHDKRRAKLTHDDIEGLVETEFDRVQLAGTAGILFKADFDCPKGSSKVTYMVCEGDLEGVEDAEWVVVPRSETVPRSEAHRWNYIFGNIL